METREKFEALPDVAIIFEGLHPTIIWFCKTANRYATSFSGFDNKVVWLNGAWHAFQEQENKIKALEKELEMRKQGAMVMSHHRDEVLSICREYWCDDDRDYNIYIQRIEELLE